MSWHVLKCTIVAIFAGLPILSPSPAKADIESISRICDSAAQFVAQETSVPLDVLRAISLTETGRKSNRGFLPWPWTVNMEGVGKWFDDHSLALDYVDRHFATGARSFDVGCFQINYKWHGHAFDSIEQMFDPITNARYAASFLTELYNELGDWSRAAGAYHSRTPKYANKYVARFERIRANLATLEQPIETVSVGSSTRGQAQRYKSENRYPLLRQTGKRRAASLVPLDGLSTPFLSGSMNRPFVIQQ